jgi:hypothetical protein
VSRDHETRRKMAKEIASKISWADLAKKPGDISIETLWRIFAASIFKGEVSATQYQETKKAYYCGFSECFRFMTDIASGLDENVACDIFSQLAKESNTYIDSLLDRTLK